MIRQENLSLSSDVVLTPKLPGDLRPESPNREAEIHLKESSMQKRTLSFLVLAFLAQVAFLGASRQARAQSEKVSYPAMAPVSEYLIPDENSEIALARSAA